MTMKELIAKLKEQPLPKEGRLVQRRDQYIRSVEELIADIKKWLEPAIQDGIMVLEEFQQSIAEDGVGAYLAKGLKITLKNKEGMTVVIEPVGAMNIGLHGGRRDRPVASLWGRVELSCGPMRIPLGLTEAGKWKAIPMQGEPAELDEQTFAEILSEVLLER